MKKKKEKDKNKSGKVRYFSNVQLHSLINFVQLGSSMVFISGRTKLLLAFNMTFACNYSQAIFLDSKNLTR